MYYVSDYTWCILLNAQPCFFGINNRTTNVDTKRAHNPKVHQHSVSNGKLISLIVMSPKHKIYFLNAKSFLCTLSNTWHVVCYICYYIHLNWICILHEAQNDRRTVYCCVCSVNLPVQTAAKIRKTKTSANVFMLFTFASRGCSTLRHVLQVEVVK